MWRVSSVLKLAGLSPDQPYYTEASRARGLYVHQANEAFARGGSVGPADTMVYAAYVAPLAEWWRDFAPTVVAVEHRFVNRDLGLTGRLDLGIVYNACGYIVDVKTGSPAPWHGPQTGGYSLLAQSDAAMLAAFLDAGAAYDLKRAVVYLPGNGKYKWVEQADPNDEYLFRAALELVKWKHRHGLITEIDDEVPADDWDHPVEA